MRITPQMIVDSTLNNIQTNQNRIEELQNQVNSGAYDVNAPEVSRHIVDFYSIPL